MYSVILKPRTIRLLQIEMYATTLLTALDELAEIETRATELFADRLPTSIDGLEVEPIVDRVQFLEVAFRGILRSL